MLKKWICLLLLALVLVTSAFAETLNLDLSLATDEELELALSAIRAEQRARIKTEVVLSATELTIGKGKTQKLTATIEGLPEELKASAFVWKSSDDKIAKVYNGTITAVSGGKATITCSTVLSNEMELTATCDVEVITAITGMSAKKTSFTIAVSKSEKLELNIYPADATNKKINYASSDESIAKVDTNGRITGVKPGSCKITAETTDGSNRKVTVNVRVPSLSSTVGEVTVYSKSGRSFDVISYYGSSKSNLNITSSNSSVATISTTFNSTTDKLTIKVTPVRAGSTTLTITDKNDYASRVTLKINIDHQAVYDTTSYPRIQYKDAARYPSAYKGDQCSFYGKVQQVLDYSGYTCYRISSSGSYDNIVYVFLDDKNQTVPLLEDDWVTVYGKHAGNITYETVMGSEITIPRVDAERINIGQK